MPRILIAASIARFVEAFLLPFGDLLRSQGWRVDVVASGASQSEAIAESFDGAHESPWTRRLGDIRQHTAAARLLRTLVREERYDLVHLHTPLAGSVGRYALRNLRKTGRPSVIYTAHGFHFHEYGSATSNLAFRLAERLGARWTDHLITINEDDHRIAEKLQMVPPERLELIKGVGIDTTQFNPARVTPAEVARVRKQLGLDAGDRLILTVGRLHPSKRHHTTLQALARLGRPSVHLAVAGDGPDLAKLKSTASRLGIADRVHFLGHRTDIATLMGASEMTVTTSEREGLSRTVLESMSMETPVIGSSIRGVRELIGDDDCGILIGLGQADQLTAAMRRLLDDRPLAASLGRRGRRLVGSYDVSTVLTAHLALYERALARLVAVGS
jgi:glycosyltransferase involved in cell wall biosynthesis